MKELKVQPIKDGTVIDHITPGNALKVLKILGIEGKEGSIISIAMNVVGKRGKKDIVKIENKNINVRQIRVYRNKYLITNDTYYNHNHTK